ncbi:hypothetical protein DMH12_15545 [Streptomyces sp. WAC 04229]|nr:hypothetical protein DMH12_15545 [Streptomyces sp. WAC 04229]
MFPLDVVWPRRLGVAGGAAVVGVWHGPVLLGRGDTDRRARHVVLPGRAVLSVGYAELFV